MGVQYWFWDERADNKTNPWTGAVPNLSNVGGHLITFSTYAEPELDISLQDELILRQLGISAKPEGR